MFFGKVNTNEKLTDQTFIKLFAISLVSIILCMAGLCSCTWAWFTGSVSSTGNTLTAGFCDLTVLVKAEDETVMYSDDMSKITQVLDAGSYTVELTIPDGSSSGYCVVTVGEENYYTDYVTNVDGTHSNKLTFELKLEDTAEVTVDPRWGKYAGDFDIAEGDALDMSAVAVKE